jgi:hypothetical protein
MRKNMVIGISSNGGMKTNRRTMKPMGMDHDGGSQTTPSLRTSFSYDHIIICHLHCRHVMVRIETIIMYKGNVVSLGNHQQQSLLVLNDDRHNNSRCCGGTVIHSCGLYDRPTNRSYVCVHDVVAVLGCEEVVVVVFISSIPAKKNTSVPETSVGHIRRPEYRLDLVTK